MKTRAIGVMLCWGLLSSVALAQKEGSPRERTTGDRVKARAERVVRDVSPAGIRVDFADETILGVTFTDRDGGIMTLEFEPNVTSDVLRPVLGERIEQELFGMDPTAFVASLTLQDANIKKGSLEAFDESTAGMPHDDVTVFVVNQELVLVFLWERGQVIGTFYAVDTDAAAERLAADQDAAGGGVAAVPSPKDIVCSILYNCCRTQCDTYWIAACGLWLLGGCA